jgi:hypothetical protein
MCIACVNDGYLPSLPKIAYRLKLTEERATTIVHGLTKLKLIDESDGLLKMHDWGEWQYTDDCRSVEKSTERVRKHRERLKQMKQNGTMFPFHTKQSETETSVSVSESVSESQKETEELYDHYQDFLALWPEDKRGVELGCQVWISLVDNREITKANLTQVFEGLDRWKKSALWAKKQGAYVPAIAKSDGGGWLQKRAWKDTPKPEDAW